METEIIEELKKDFGMTENPNKDLELKKEPIEKFKELTQIFILQNKDKDTSSHVLMIPYNKLREAIFDLIIHYGEFEKQVGAVDWPVLLLRMIDFPNERSACNQPLKLKPMKIMEDSEMIRKVKSNRSLLSDLEILNKRCLS